MPTTIKQLFDASNIENIHKEKWGTIVENQRQGVYIVSMSPIPDENAITLEKPNFNYPEIAKWIDKLPDFTIDGVKPTIELLKKRLTEFWLPDESILYIGKAPKRSNGDGLGQRIYEYYITEIGEGRPHSGGQWIKTLSNLETSFVYYGYCNDPTDVERQMLDLFMANVSIETVQSLRDSSLPLPFANIRYKPMVDKKHGMKNQRRK